jgi:hypothetical protein
MGGATVWEEKSYGANRDSLYIRRKKRHLLFTLTSHPVGFQKQARKYVFSVD